VRRFAVIGGPIQVLLTWTSGAVAAKYGLQMTWIEAIWFGAMISVSSTMVVLKTLSAEGVTSTLASRVMIGLLVIQDLAVVPMLIILPQMGDPNHLIPKLARSLAIATAVLLAVFFLGTRLLPKLLRLVLAWGSRELFLVSVVAIGIGVGYATQAFGISFALGAFVAGLILSESEFSHQALSDVVPLRDIFGLLFFVTVGMLFDPSFVMAHPGQIAVLVFLIFLGKSLIIGGLARVFGYGNMAPWIIGLGLSQIGEFSFVLARTGVSAGALSRPTYNLALTCTILTMSLSPVVSGAALPIGRAWRRWRKPLQSLATVDLPNTELRGHVIVAGYGRSGRAVASVLWDAGIRFVVAELDHAAFSDVNAQGHPAVWGDIAQEPVLHAAHIENARVIVLTVPDQGTIRLSAERARKTNPSVIVIARAMRERNVMELRELGINATVQPEFEGGIEMGRQALIQYDYDDIEVSRLVSKLRSSLYG